MRVSHPGLKCHCHNTWWFAEEDVQDCQDMMCVEYGDITAYHVSPAPPDICPWLLIVPGSGVVPAANLLQAAAANLICAPLPGPALRRCGLHRERANFRVSL